MKDDKNKIETVLFTTGRFTGLDELSKMTGIGIDLLKDILIELKNDYSNKNSSLEIINHGEKWKLNIRKEYLHLTENMLTTSELDRPTQETLAIIAYKNPVLQSEVINIRGNKAYDHVKSLRELEFVTSEKSGRTRLLKLTQKFFDYFDVVEEKLKEKLKEVEDKD